MKKDVTPRNRLYRVYLMGMLGGIKGDLGDYEATCQEEALIRYLSTLTKVKSYKIVRTGHIDGKFGAEARLQHVESNRSITRMFKIIPLEEVYETWNNSEN